MSLHKFKLSTLVLTSITTSLLINSAFANKEVVASEVSLSPQEIQLTSWVDQRQVVMIDELASHVNINTGTANIDGINTYRDLLEQNLIDLGFKTEQHSSDSIPVLNCSGGEHQIANHLVATRKGSSKRRILINGHLDTVFSKGDDFQTLEIAQDGTLKGPGVADMKGGMVIMLNSLRALDSIGLLEEATITVLLNSDEEIGSLGSRSLIETLAKQHDIGFVFEGSYNNMATRARKGLGQARIKIIGRESHAGAAHEDGVSANLELAHKVIEIEKLTDYSRNTTVNVGVMAGGEKRNTISGCADAYIDMRFPSQQDGEKLKTNILDIASNTVTNNPNYPELPIIESWAVLHRPVKQQNDQVDNLIAEAMGLSKLIGEPITGTRYSGGGTDGSIAQAVGLPTIDSFGMDGLGAHSSREQSSVKTLMARTKLAAVMLARQIDLGNE